MLLLAGCISPEEQRGQELALDSQRCASLGFASGSPEMAQCMNTAASTRAADWDRAAQQQAAWQAQQAREARDRQRQQAADDAAGAQKAQDDYERVQSIMNSSSTITVPSISGSSGTPDSGPLPSAAAIPGMVCTGVGDDAACDAR